MVTLCLHSSSQLVSDLTRRTTSSTRRRRESWRWPRGWLLEDLMSDNRPVPPHTSRRTHSDCEKVSAALSPLISVPLTPQIAIPLFIMWGVVERETNKTHYNTEDELKPKVTSKFTSVNKETVGKACTRFSIRLEAVVEAYDKFFE